MNHISYFREQKRNERALREEDYQILYKYYTDITQIFHKYEKLKFYSGPELLSVFWLCELKNLPYSHVIPQIDFKTVVTRRLKI